jgi:pentatricopeptide repeat protein
MLTAQLVRVYARQGGVEHVLRVFNGMPGRNSFVWNTVIKGLVDAGQFYEVLERYWDTVRNGFVAADYFMYPPILYIKALDQAHQRG